MDFYEDTSADKRIKTCIDEQRNFTVVAGAGSGKTGSLIKALAYVRQQYGNALRTAGQQVACITYTNAATDVIRQRTDLDELFFISTIHSFLWNLVKSYQEDVCTTLGKDLLPQRIAKKMEEDDGGQSKKALQAHEQVTRLTQDLANLSKVKRFSYDESGRRNYSTGNLGHDDIIDLVSIMISKMPMLQRIIGQKFPYIFIDEAQDTFYNVMESLNLVARADGLPIIGYFGDPMQQIYFDNRAGEFKGPEGAEVITKLENYRCSTEVINLLKVIRPDLQQIPGPKNINGSVGLRLIQAEKGIGNRNTYTDEQVSRALVQFDIAMAHFGWSKFNEVKQLFLTWQMIAHRLGFSKLNRLFTGVYASETAQDAFRKGEHFALQPFIDVLVPLIEANTKHDQITMTQIMRQYSPILDPKGVNEFATIKEVTNKVQIAIDDLIDIWPHSSIRDVLEVARKHQLITISEHLAEQLDRHPRTESYDETKYSQEKEDWLIDEYLTYQTDELSSYRDFLLESTPFGTQHGAKGEQFEKVLVIFDDTEAQWNIFSFSRLFTPITAGSEATEGQRKHSLNLAYVCFSRAIRDLRIILFTADPEKAKKELVEKGLFADHQVSVQLLNS
jgi:DNA helicase-2/ATP-dependent DNA helicase PcrA